MGAQAFSFAMLDQRLRDIPDGPAAVLNTPRWVLPFNLAGWIGVLLGVLPSALIHFVAPAWWMVWMAQGGLYLAIAGFAPEFVRSVIVLAVSFRHWRPEQVRQLDHDLVRFRELREWLSQFSPDARNEALRFVRQNRERLASKLGLIAGSLEKLGVLPIAVAVGIQLKAWSVEPGDLPLWQALLAMFLVLTYAVGFVAALMRLRLELYEMVLTDSLASRGVPAQP